MIFRLVFKSMYYNYYINIICVNLVLINYII